MNIEVHGRVVMGTKFVMEKDRRFFLLHEDGTEEPLIMWDEEEFGEVTNPTHIRVCEKYQHSRISFIHVFVNRDDIWAYKEIPNHEIEEPPREKLTLTIHIEIDYLGRDLDGEALRKDISKSVDVWLEDDGHIPKDYSNVPEHMRDGRGMTVGQCRVNLTFKKELL